MHGTPLQAHLMEVEHARLPVHLGKAEVAALTHPRTASRMGSLAEGGDEGVVGAQEVFPDLPRKVPAEQRGQCPRKGCLPNREAKTAASLQGPPSSASPLPRAAPIHDSGIL